MDPKASTRPFGPVHVVEPTDSHTHTAIFLHGRGSNGPEFAEELFDESRLADQTTLAERFPGWRWVFPSSQQLWSTVFEMEIPAWFEAHSLTDITTRQDLQMPGITESVEHLTAVVQSEIRTLGGEPGKVVLGGMSQGGAIAMWTLLQYSMKSGGGQLGAFVGTSTWVPFAESIKSLSNKAGSSGEDALASVDKTDGEKFVESMMGALTRVEARGGSLFTPVFLGHGTDDGVVDVELGRQARDALRNVGFEVEWKEYVGAELEGHWLKVPEEVDDIADFLGRLVK